MDEPKELRADEAPLFAWQYQHSPGKWVSLSVIRQTASKAMETYFSLEGEVDGAPVRWFMRMDLEAGAFRFTTDVPAGLKADEEALSDAIIETDLFDMGKKTD